MKSCVYIMYFLLLLMYGCVNSPAVNEEDAASEDPVTPVTITHPLQGSINETVDLNATSSYTLKINVKANVTGYLQTAGIKLGEYVSGGQTLFTIKTKEAVALGNTVNQLDSSLHFHGTTRITSPVSGYITQLNYTAGDYVQDGEQLAEVTARSGFAFILDVPYELKPYLPANKKLLLHLADSTILQGNLQRPLPSVDSASQTQRYLINVSTEMFIPENLIARVQLLKQQVSDATMLPKAAVLSNEEQTEFWIMKLINDSIAVRTSVKKGMESNGNVQIIEPMLNDSDRIILTGNYGLNDTAKVQLPR